AAAADSARDRGVPRAVAGHAAAGGVAALPARTGAPAGAAVGDRPQRLVAAAVGRAVPARRRVYRLVDRARAAARRPGSAGGRIGRPDRRRADAVRARGRHAVLHAEPLAGARAYGRRCVAHRHGAVAPGAAVAGAGHACRVARATGRAARGRRPAARLLPGLRLGPAATHRAGAGHARLL
ncbi:MAG: hypothetical protein AVDCRST_MAG71-699, partial [uncultured Lysobacter sp.]